MSAEKESYSEYRRRRRKRKKKSYGCFLLIFLLITVFAMAGYGIYQLLHDEESKPYVPVSPQSNVQKAVTKSEKTIVDKKAAQQVNTKYDKLFGDARYLIHIHKQSYLLDLYEKGKAEAIRTYGVAVAKNSGDKQRTGDNRTPTSWGKAVDIPKSYKGAEPGVDSLKVPFRVEEVCDASDWTHDFGDGKGVIEGAYGPWFISLDTGWDGIGIHGTHDPSSIGTMASEGCIRLNNSDVAELKKIIYNDRKGVGTRVIITEK